MPRVRNTPVASERKTSTFAEDAAFPLPISSLPTLDSIPQSARHQRKAASRHTVPGSSSTPAHIPRPRNAYVLYRSWALSYHPSIAGAKASNKQDVLSKMTGELWNAESDGVRSHFAALAAEEKDRHAERYPEYSYMPKHGGTEKTVRRQPVATSRRVGRKKYDEDEDDYTPGSRSRALLTSSRLYTPFVMQSADLLAHTSASPTTSANVSDEYRTATSFTGQRFIDEAAHASAAKKGDKKRSRLAAGRVQRKRCDDDDEYVPEAHALPSFSYDHRYTHSNPSSPAVVTPCDQSSASSSSSVVSLEGPQTPTSLYMTNEAPYANATYSPSIAHSGLSVEPNTPPGSPESSYSTSSHPSETSSFLSPETNELPETAFACPSPQPVPHLMTTYASPDELSSLFNTTQAIEDLFAPYLMGGPLPCVSSNLWDADDLLPPQSDAASDEDIFSDMISSYTNL